MNQIIITINEFGWKKELTLNGQTYTEEHERTPYGSTGKSVFEDIKENLIRKFIIIYLFIIITYMNK